MNYMTNKPRVLIVDDEPAIRKILETYLSNHFEVETVDNGRACLEWLKKGEHPDAIILDLVLPEVHGMDIIPLIRKTEEGSQTALLVLSAKDSSVDRVAALRAGADDYLVKPFNPEELEVRIMTVLRRTGKVAVA